MAVAVRVIPCLDVDAGRVVKGINFQENSFKILIMISVIDVTKSLIPKIAS